MYLGNIANDLFGGYRPQGVHIENETLELQLASVVPGFTVGKVLPETESTNSLLIKHFAQLTFKV
jgi:hypothetical protein